MLRACVQFRALRALSAGRLPQTVSSAGVGLAIAASLRSSCLRPAICEPALDSEAEPRLALPDSETKGATLVEQAVEDSLPLVSLEELRTHASEASCWVVLNGVVYDVTDFAREHPGGAEALFGAGGQDISTFWNHYRVHYASDAALTALSGCRKVGVLSDEDCARLADDADAENVAAAAMSLSSSAVERAQERSRRSVWRIVLVGMQGPLWSIARLFLRTIGAFFPSTIERLVELLPVSVPGYAQRRPLERSGHNRKRRVAVIGGGIAGVGCAYTLRRSGFDVTVYEARERLGGNAQTAQFRVGEKTVAQDLSVLFWAPEYYKNYTMLLEDLGIEPVSLSVPTAVHSNRFKAEGEFFTPPGSALHEAIGSPLADRFAADLRKFEAMMSVCRAAVTFFTWGDDSPSFYKSTSLLSQVNPLNFITGRQLISLCGISDDFYETVVRPFHGLQFTTFATESIPAVALTVVDDIVPLSRVRTHTTWGPGTSEQVFERAARGVDVKLSTRARVVSYEPAKAGDVPPLVVRDQLGHEARFDRVVFACPATAAASALSGAESYEQTLLRGVAYHDDVRRADWRDWLEASVHQDTSVLPIEHRADVLRHAAFVVSTDVNGGRGGKANHEVHHVLGSWSPGAAAFAVGADPPAMFMTQCHHAHRSIDEAKVVGSFSAPRSHPDLSYRNLAITQMMHLVQGRHGVFFCGNWCSPGNGHDLSFLGGVVVACAIGADYPYEHNAGAKKDYMGMRQFMGL